MHGPRDQAVALHLAQRLREHLLADTFNQFAQARETQLTFFRQYLKHEHRPLVGYTSDQVVNEGFNLGVEVVGGSTGGVNLRPYDLLFGELRNPWHFLHSPLGKYGTLWCLLPFGEYRG